MALTAKLVENFAGIFLSPMYDNPKPTPEFHRQGWELYCSDYPYCSIVAPREHAKSTAFTHDYILATILFREQDYVIVLSATEELAMGHLGDISRMLREDDDLKKRFGIKGLLVDAKSDCVVEFGDGHQARIVAKGTGQKMRGMKWNGKRPGLIVCDDLEEDEQVESVDRRRLFRNWFNRALLPSLRNGGIVRVHGTILHPDSLLARLQRNKEWHTLFFKAHNSFDEFNGILWPEQFPEKRLRAIQRRYIEDDDAAGYSQEYLNNPLDEFVAFLGADGFLDMSSEEREGQMLIHMGCDFAVSKKDHANRTSFTVGGVLENNVCCIIDQHAGRWDTGEWIERMFELETVYRPKEWTVEGGVIWEAVWPVIRQEMQRRDVWMNFNVIQPLKDKATRALAFRKRHRAGSMRYDKHADWYAGYESELKMFTPGKEAIADDQFDSTAIMVRGFEEQSMIEPEDFMDEDELEMQEYARQVKYTGRSPITGY
jgi:predicted phage terminase large subunit-like protein